MATLILTTIGTAVGGPIGGAIGAVLGQQVDGRLFAPKARQGPRLGELSVQTSSYGTQIPKIFGTMRVAGTVIWATDLREERSKSGGGKGQPKTVTYSYSANFAVALSGREIRAVRRIWADGKLLRGAAGDFKTQTGYRLHLGTEDQMPDPLIVAAEAAGATPAYRGIAYAVFENFQLTDYGNRIPSLTFEVEADVGAVTVGEIAEMLSGGEVVGASTAMLGGYAATGDSVRGAIESLTDLQPISLIDDGVTLSLAGDAEEPLILDASEPGVTAAGSGGRSEWQRLSGDAAPSEATLTYYDRERDYQSGLQRASRGEGRGGDRRAVAAVLEASDAKALVEHRLEALWSARRLGKVHLGWSRSALRPGQRVRIAGRPGLWRLSRFSLERMVVTLELTGCPALSAPIASQANPGRPIGSPDLRHGPTTLLPFDIPSLGEEVPRGPRILVAAAGQEEGWRRAELIASYDGGASWASAGATAAPAVMGSAVTVPGAAGSAVFDSRHNFEVQLLNEGMWLESRSDAALVAGANLAVLGAELIQFGVAEPLGSRRFRLSRLFRARRGTEWAVGAHQVAEPFALLETGAVAVIEPPLATLGTAAHLLATGLDDPQGAEAVLNVTGEALRPPSPVHLRGERLPNGDIALSWVRRSRAGWSWMSGSDTPLGEEVESYRLTLSGADGGRTVTVAAPDFFYSAQDQSADGATGAVTATVVQLGTSAASRETRTIID